MSCPKALLFSLFANDKISKEDYDNWRYTYPKEEAKRFADLIDERREKRLRGKSDD
ncbi:MAG: hypothetical protein LBH86_08610 [Oscillospiraceae bacterium]|nr:hypothetical protein [Oscillospiraceae bacterium]